MRREPCLVPSSALSSREEEVAVPSAFLFYIEREFVKWKSFKTSQGGVKDLEDLEDLEEIKINEGLAHIEGLEDLQDLADLEDLDLADLEGLAGLEHLGDIDGGSLPVFTTFWNLKVLEIFKICGSVLVWFTWVVASEPKDIALLFFSTLERKESFAIFL